MRSASQYGICAHAHTCIAGGHIVFLDVERDKYLCLDLEATATLLPYLRRRSFLFQDPLLRECAAWAAVARILAELEQRNLIALVPLAEVVPGVEQAAVPTQSISGTLDSEYHRTAAGACEVFLAVLRCAMMLRWRTFAKTVSRVTRRRRSAVGSRTHAERESLVQRFVAHRFRFGKTDACLLSSLALLEFLAPHGLYPQLVFGVRMRPFQAHCWVQHEVTVLGDTLDRVTQFTPIMVA
jgi:hypothetical protein